MNKPWRDYLCWTAIQYNCHSKITNVLFTYHVSSTNNAYYCLMSSTSYTSKILCTTSLKWSIPYLYLINNVWSFWPDIVSVYRGHGIPLVSRITIHTSHEVLKLDITCNTSHTIIIIFSNSVEYGKPEGK
jgi:hypothetical protein